MLSEAAVCERDDLLHMQIHVHITVHTRLLLLAGLPCPTLCLPLSLSVSLSVSVFPCLREVALNARCDMRDALSASIGNFRVICKQLL